ncbi:hypothetical protein OQI_38295 [Streptomyces pharetrae CZA14]|uniref:STAS domain-containing protein n=1 Tax=Streptomyces pharetrae CZA14 TaxID=1144883 RepID=A0ABX3Y7B5_9ACTN|nr:hypothetical protein OQI_38295 [Streptomyces pharetrae CZA14]
MHHPTVRTSPAALTVHVSGELDHGTGHDPVGVVVGHLVPGVRDVRLDLTGLTRIAPLGLAALLMLHRHTSAVRATVHRDNRPDALDRVLRQTNVLAHLTAPLSGHRTPARAVTVAPRHGGDPETRR